jgi:transposase-like protein
MTCPECSSKDVEEVDAINGVAKYECQSCGHDYWEDEIELPFESAAPVNRDEV